MVKINPAQGAYVVLGVISFARVVTWLATGFGESPHVGFLALFPTSVVALVWAVAGVTTMTGAWSYKFRLIGVTLTAVLNASVGTASFLNRTIGDTSGITMSVAISYLGIAVMAIILPRLTDAETVLEGVKEVGHGR